MLSHKTAACVLTLCLFAPCFVAAQISFDEPDFHTGRSPQAIASADFNGDGIPDIATANRDDNTVSILLGKGAGLWGPRMDLAAGAAPIAIVAGDFNHDGMADLAVLNGANNSISILLGNGDGTFHAKVDYQVGAGADSLVAADFNGDGSLDLATANSGANTISVLLGQSNGTFGAKQDYAAAPAPASLVTGDFNHDGHPDLAVVNSFANTVSILIGNGNGTFNLPASFQVDIPAFIAVGDLNRDGIDDLLVEFRACQNGGCTDVADSYLGNGDGTFTATGTPLGVTPSVPTIADLNGDGIPDLVTGLFGGVAVYFGGPDGTFSFTRQSFTPTGRFAVTQVVGDFNGDGIRDIATVNSPDNTVSMLLGNGDGTLLPRHKFDVFEESGGADTLVTADFNGDGKADIAVVHFSGKLDILAGKGDGTFLPKQLLHAGNSGSALATADFNRDGLPDLAVANIADKTVSILLNNGDGTFRGPVSFTTGGSPQSLGVGDFNRDGIPDLVVANSADNTVSILLGNGDGTFQAKMDFGTHQGPTSIAVADLNGDGILDLAIANLPDDSITVLLGKGDGTFSTLMHLFVGSHPTSVTTGDFNGDGIPDLAVAISSPPHVSILVGIGNGTFNPAVDYPTSSGPRFVLSADFDGDGIPDLAVIGDFVSILKGNGDGTFQPEIEFVPGGTFAAAIGDFNADGKVDLALLDTSVVSLLMNTATATGPECTANPQSVHLCLPAHNATVASPVDVSGVGNIKNRQLLRLYLDNQPLFQTKASLFHQQFSMAAGSHHLVLVGYDNTGAAFTDDVFFTVSGDSGCSQAPGVHICEPVNGANVGTSVRLRASANVPNFTLLRVYDNNKKVYETGNHELDINLGLTPGSNHLVLVAYNTTGNAFTAETTVDSSGSGAQLCTVATDRTINICFPNENSNTGASFQLQAHARWDNNVITHMRVYVDNQPVFDEETPADGFINPVLTVSTGTHQIVVVAWNLNGEAIASPVRTAIFFK